MLLKIISVLLLFIISCADNMLYYRSTMYRQRLVVRLNYPEKLTNQICLRKEEGICKQWETIEYDMNDAAFRRKANDFGFICSIAGKRWRICLDTAGYCRRECINRNAYSLKCYKFIEKIIPASQHQYLYDAGTFCKSYYRD